MNTIRLKKIESEISKFLSEILANEASDSLLKTITITGTEVANDLSYAKVFFTSLSALPAKDLEKELIEAASYLRTELASRIELRHTPKLRFAYDNSIAYGHKIESIIKEIRQEAETNERPTNS